MENSRVEWLIQKMLDGTADRKEKDELFAWVRNKNQAEVCQQALERQWHCFQEDSKLSKEANEDLFNSVLQAARMLEVEHPGRVRLLAGWKKWAATAAVIVVLITAGYFLLVNPKPDGRKLAGVERPLQDIQPPDASRATVQLSDGRLIYLDSVSTGELIKHDKVKLSKLANGQLMYETIGDKQSKGTGYHTLMNPMGSRPIQLAMSDGSQVWLNAGSSISYPVVFSGNERKVTMSGEAYFEIADNKSMPFKVNKGAMTVEVLGTHFNIKAYDDENDIKVSLLEGSVRVSANRQKLDIRPGQQAVVSGNNLSFNRSVNMDEVMAWKNGRFLFNGASLEQIMLQVSRWYNVKVVFKNHTNETFVADIERDLPVSRILGLLSMTRQVKFEIEKDTVYVMKY